MNSYEELSAIGGASPTPTNPRHALRLARVTVEAGRSRRQPESTPIIPPSRRSDAGQRHAGGREVPRATRGPPQTRRATRRHRTKP